MFGFLIAGLFITSAFAEKWKPDDDISLYDAIDISLKELKARQLAEESGLFDPNIFYSSTSTSVCYDELGCFDKNGTFKHIKQLPEPPETVNTKFLLYTRKNVYEPQFLNYKKPETIVNSHIIPNAPIKFITHGFGGKNNISWIWQMKTEMLKQEDINVVAIDWSLGARLPYYMQAAVNTELVGAEAAIIFFLIKDKFGIQEKDLHVIGFSLGAHVAGFMGKKMMELEETRPGRITGLDPASPLFEDYGEEVHLNKEDADYVDIVHTNADSFYYGGVGIEKSIGHVDYYPNGGKRQPGCGSTLSGMLKDIIKNDRERVCNHERAVHLYIESISKQDSCEFNSYRCKDYSDFELGKCMNCDEQCGRMGYHSKASGVFYLMTSANKPFCAGLAKLTVKFPENIKKAYGSIILTIIGSSGNKQNITVTQKDAKLLAETEIVKAVPITDTIRDFSSIEALYVSYNGWLDWLTKKADTTGLASVILKDTKGQFIFKSCEEVNLKDKEYKTLKQTDRSC